MTRTLPTFDPKNSARVAVDILEKLNIKGALIGRLAIWAWLPDNSDKQAYTKDLDVAVSKTDLVEIKKYLMNQPYEVRELSIGGINIKDDPDINVDFIDRSAIEWSDYSMLYEDAIHEAVAAERIVNVGDARLCFVSIEYLIVMKLATAEKHDEDDAKVLLSEIEYMDFKELRRMISKYLGPLGRNRFEIILKDIGHKESRIIKYSNSY